MEGVGLMQQFVVGEDSGIALPAGATSLVITHEWGDVVYEYDISSPDPISWTPDSIGMYRLEWSNGTTHAKGYLPLLSRSDLEAINPELSHISDELFAFSEEMVRQIIENFTGQEFGPYINKTLRIPGDGGDSLFLPVSAQRIESIVDDAGAPYDELIEVAPSSSFFLQQKSLFGRAYSYDAKRDIFFNTHDLFNARKTFNIRGDFGWQFVPPEVVTAAKLLIADAAGGDDVSGLRDKGVFEAQMGDFKLRLNADQWGTTGNVKADLILSKHVVLGIGLV